MSVITSIDYEILWDIKEILVATLYASMVPKPESEEDLKRMEEEAANKYLTNVEFSALIDRQAAFILIALKQRGVLSESGDTTSSVTKSSPSLPKKVEELLATYKNKIIRRK